MRQVVERENCDIWWNLLTQSIYLKPIENPFWGLLFIQSVCASVRASVCLSPNATQLPPKKVSMTKFRQELFVFRIIPIHAFMAEIELTARIVFTWELYTIIIIVYRDMVTTSRASHVWIQSESRNNDHIVLIKKDLIPGQWEVPIPLAHLSGSLATFPVFLFSSCSSSSSSSPTHSRCSWWSSCPPSTTPPSSWWCSSTWRALLTTSSSPSASSSSGPTFEGLLSTFTGGKSS